MMWRAVWVALGFVVALDGAFSASACNSSCSISASNYDRSCTQDSDCIGIFAGDLCGAMCACVNAAINVRDESKYESDVARIGAGPACPCPGASVACNDGECGMGPAVRAPFDAASADAAGEGAGDGSAEGQESDDATIDGDTGSCGLAVDAPPSLLLSTRGGPKCSACVLAQCCPELTACDTPDDAGLDALGFTACGEVLRCTFDYVSGAGAARDGSADANDAFGAAAVSCRGFAGASGDATAESVVACLRDACATECPGL